MRQPIRGRFPGAVSVGLLSTAVVLFCAVSASPGDEPANVPALRSPLRPMFRQAGSDTAAHGIDPANRTEHVIRLPAVTAASLRFAGAKGLEHLGGRAVPQVGLCRPFSPQAVAEAVATGQWVQGRQGGWEWRLKVCSPGAVAVRVYLQSFDLPTGASLVVQGQDQVAGPFFARGPFKTGEFWTPSVSGETAELIYRQDATAGPPLSPPFELADVAHIYKRQGTGGAKVGSCQQDLACWPEWGDAGYGVGLVEFVSGGSVYLCSGALLNNAREDFTPYFLTAHHCIATEQEAQSAEVFWAYQTSTCNGSPPARSSVASTTGATLLVTAPHWEFSDVSLLRLTGPLPDGLTYAGWTTQPIAPEDPVVGIHHPDGSFKRICFGNLLIEGNPDRSRAPIYWVVLWNLGTTEPGSSGSPLFNAEQQVIGQLYGGSASCEHMDLPDYYGKFAAAYPFLAPYLDPDAPPGQDDEFEQNDVPAEAAVVQAGTYGELMLLDDDWYQLKLDAHQTVQVQIVFDHLVADLDLAIYDDQLVRQANSAGTETNSENVQLAAGEAEGTYLIHVYGFEGSSAAYAMTIQLGQGSAPPGEDDAYEENDSAFDAAPMGAGLYEDLVAWDEDWYRLEVQPGWQLTVQIEFLHAAGDLDMVLYDEEFHELARSDGVGNSEQVVNTNHAKTTQTFYLEVYGYGEDTNSYSMRIMLDADPQSEGCGAGVGLANLTLFWNLCLAWLVAQKLRFRRWP